MTQIQLLFFVLLIFLFSNLGCAQSLESKIDSLYHVKEGAPGFSIAVFKENEILLEKQYGNTNLDYDIPITSETVFDIGSIGKQFTAAAILLLENQGKLSIKDPAYKYIENLPRYKKGNPTIEHLLNQTSGIKEVDNYLEVLDIYYRDYINQSMLINIITTVNELRFPPGAYFEYTNANYILLASIIEKVSEMDYSDYLQESIFDPLKMQNTMVNTDIYKTIKNRAIGYTEEGGKFYKTHYYSLFYKGDGQILTHPKDMFKWHQGIKKATIGTPNLWKRMQTKAKLNDGRTINYGLGVEFETHNGYEAFGFDGMITSGFVSKYLYFPTSDIAFFTTQNTFDWDFRERFFNLVDLYIPVNGLKKNPSKYSEITLSINELKKYEGHYLFYRHDKDRKANTIKLINDDLYVVTLEGDQIAKLIPIGNHRFLFGEDRDAIVEFEFNGNTRRYTYDELSNELPWVFNEFQPYEYPTEELKEFEGQYFNNEFQISKKLLVENGKLYYYYRNGASKNEMTSLSKDILEIPISPIEFIRNEKQQIKGFKIMGLLFKKIETS